MINNSDDLDKIFIPLLETIYKESQGKWLDNNNKYKLYRKLQIDKRGSLGERFFKQILENIYTRRSNIEYRDGDQGDWDLKFNGYKFEIKTSSMSENNKFQNEGIKRNADYYGIIFFGIKPNELFMKCMLKENIPFDDLHDRVKNKTGSGFKYDFKEKDMIKISTLKDVKEEFEKHFKKTIKKKK